MTAKKIKQVICCLADIGPIQTGWVSGGEPTHCASQTKDGSLTRGENGVVSGVTAVLVLSKMF